MTEADGFDPAWYGHAALLLVLAWSLSSRQTVMRAALAVAAVLMIYAWFFLYLQPFDGAIAAMIGLVNAAFLLGGSLRNRRARFTDEEMQLRAHHLGGLDDYHARRLIDQGHWINAKRGEVLVRERAAAPSLFYLGEGEAAILRDGVEVARVASGELIGEATVLDGTHATGAVELVDDSRLWFVPAQALRRYLAANPKIAATLHEGFARALRGKLANANARLAENPPLL